MSLHHLGSLYYQNGCPDICYGCHQPFREHDGHKIAVHVHGLGYFCSSQCAQTAREQLQPRLQHVQ
jgi:hypothetical protein